MNTIIEKIRAEVERLKQEGDIALQDAVETNDIESGFVCGGIISTCEKLLAKLDTLQEQPVCEGLEDEIERMYLKDTLTLRTRAQYANLARHFAKWGAEHLATPAK